MSEHTKGPWRMGNAGYGAIVADEVVNNLGANTEESVKAYGGYLIAESVSKANAEHIINCVNSHNALLDQITDLKEEAAAAKKIFTDASDMMYRQIYAMQAAVVASRTSGAIAGMKWIEDTLEGPDLVDLLPSHDITDAQAYFDEQIKELEEFRAKCNAE